MFSNYRKIQEESLRTYIFTYAETYDCLSLERLAEMFGLTLQSVHSIVSKMIFREEFLVSSSLARCQGVGVVCQGCGLSVVGVVLAVTCFFPLATGIP